MFHKKAAIGLLYGCGLGIFACLLLIERFDMQRTGLQLIGFAFIGLGSIWNLWLADKKRKAEQAQAEPDS